jgi:methanogenic corrinoid protein MtbC1
VATRVVKSSSVFFELRDLKECGRIDSTMKTNGEFVAQILETSAAGYAGMATSLLLERLPEIATRYAPDGFSAWKNQYQQWLLDLSAAVGAGEPKLFEARMLWAREAFVARQTSVEDLQAALGALRDLLTERLPGDSAEAAVPIVERALEAVASTGSDPASDLDANRPGPFALSYLEKILKGNPREAIESVLLRVDDGASVSETYLQVLIPALREAGRMWHAGDLSIAGEHVVTTTTQRAMALLCERGQASERKNKTVVLGCAAGNIHDIGTRATSDFFEMAGWRPVDLGADVPAEEIARSVEVFDADVIVLSAVLDVHIKAVQRAIMLVRGLEGRKIKIIVGGAAFENAPELWRKIGADGYSPRVEDAEPLACRLTQS